MKLLVGLGNPGPKYQLTRHNVGFLLVDALAEHYGSRRSFKSEFKAETQKLNIGPQQILVVKPQTFMNLSGEAVQPLLSYYQVDLTNLLVVHDEVDLPFGQLKFQKQRGHGGHNGVRHIHQQLGTDNYARLRVGVGRPPPGSPIDVATFVLQNFSTDEMAKLPDLISLLSDGIAVWANEGFEKAMNAYNAKGL